VSSGVCWNPVYGYFHLYCYKPLRRLLPRWLAVWITFVACGFVLHDLVGWIATRHLRWPEMTLLFVILGLGVVLSEFLKLNRFPFVIRVAANVAYVGGSWALVAWMAP
jgi:hypothetical protein